MRFLQCGFTACDIIHMASDVLCGASDYVWSQSSGNQLALSHHSFSPCAFAVSQWCLPIKCLLTRFLPSLPASSSSPHSSTSLSAAAFDMKHWIFHQLLWLSPLPIQLFSWNPSFVCWKQLVFLKCIYTKSRCVALCADIQAFSVHTRCTSSRSYLVVLKSFSVTL